MSFVRSLIFADIDAERDRQENIGVNKRTQGIDWRSCADPEMEGGDWVRNAVLGEEVGEVSNALLEKVYGGSLDNSHLRDELIQVAAVAVAWVEYLDS